MTKDESLKLVQEALEALENISTALREDDVLGSDIELMLNTISKIHAALAQPESNPWREAVEDELMTAHILNDSHSDPRKAVKDAIDWYVQVALDPQISSDAAALIDRGMKQERALWELSRLGQEIEAQPERDPWREAVAQPERDPWREAVAQPKERNFCPRCGKRTADLTTIHTCTPPQEKT